MHAARYLSINSGKNSENIIFKHIDYNKHRTMSRKWWILSVSNSIKIWIAISFSSFSIGGVLNIQVAKLPTIEQSFLMSQMSQWLHNSKYIGNCTNRGLLMLKAILPLLEIWSVLGVFHTFLTISWM